MSLTAEALATLRGPAPSREKYPDWQVARVERLPPSRKCKAELLGADGLREYSFFNCVNGCGIDVKVLSDSLRQHKNQAIDDHLSTSVSGDVMNCWMNSLIVGAIDGPMIPGGQMRTNLYLTQCTGKQ